MSQHLEISTGIFPFVTEGAFDGKFSTRKPHCPPRSGLTWGFGIDFGAKHYYDEDQKVVDFFKAVGLHKQAAILKKYKIAGVVGTRVKFKKSSQYYQKALQEGIAPTRANGSSFEIGDLSAKGVVRILSATEVTRRVNNDLKAQEEQGEDLFLSAQQAIDITNQEWKRRMKSVENTIQRFLGSIDFYPPLKCPLTKALYGGNAYVNAILSAMKPQMLENATITNDQERWIDQCNIIIKTMNTIDASGDKDNPKKYLINKKRGNIVFVEKIRDILLSGGSVRIKEAAEDNIQLDDLLDENSFTRELFVEMKAAYVEAKKYKGNARNYTSTEYRQAAFIIEVKRIIGTTGETWTIADDEQLDAFVQAKYDTLKDSGIPAPPVVQIDGKFDELARQWLLRTHELDLEKVETSVQATIQANSSLDAGLNMLTRLETIVEEERPISEYYNYFIKIMNKGTANIASSVGEGGDNNERDVIKIKALLANLNLYDYSSITQLQESQQNLEVKAALLATNDGLLIPAIRTFQERFSRNPDGRVDANGATLRRLNRLALPQENATIEQETPSNQSTSFSPDFMYEIQGLKILLSNYFAALENASICHEQEVLYRDLEALINPILAAE